MMDSRELLATQSMRIAEAARWMSERNIGCLPVVIPNTMDFVGIETETATIRSLLPGA